MYGMVNKAVEDMVCSVHGEAMWQRIKERAGINVEVFISNEGYPDEMTYKLVGAASELTGTPPAQILEAFGDHWVKTAEAGYGELLNAGGRTLREFLINLPDFHARVSMVMPKLKPPIFKVSHVEERSLHLHYYTHRPGLVPFVFGLIRGLSRKYKTPLRNLALIGSREQGADHDTFLIEW